MKTITVCLFAVFLLSPALAQAASPPRASLFLTPQEEHEAAALARRLAPSGKGNIHLGAILYYGANDWTLWLQGEKWTPETSREDIEVLDVSEDRVRVLWNNPENKKQVEVVLRPNQSYQIATGEVISER